MGYVRERYVVATIRTGPVMPPEGEVLIGYAVLKRSAPGDLSQGFDRKVFTLQPGDRYFDPEGDFREGSGAPGSGRSLPRSVGQAL